MKIVAAVPFELDKGGEIFQLSEAGFHRVNADLKTLGEKTAANRDKAEGLDAISSSTAHLLKIHNDMRDGGLTRGYCEEQWRKVIVIYILSEYRAYDVSVNVIREKDCSEAGWEFLGQRITKVTGVNDIYMLRLSGKDIAIFDEKGFLLPVRNFPDEVNAELGEDCIEALQKYERDIVLTYLKGFSDSVEEYQYYLKRFADSLIQKGAERREIRAIKEQVSGNFGAEDNVNGPAWKYFRKIPKLPLKLPGVFAPTLVIAPTEMRNRNIVGFGNTHTFVFQIKAENIPYYFSGFLPLSEEMADFLEKNRKEAELTGITADTSQFELKKEIEIGISLKIHGENHLFKEEIFLKKRYHEREILYMDSIPLLTIFPYVDLPEERWKQYYMVLKPRIARREGTGAPEFLKGLNQIPGEALDMMEPDFRRSRESGSDGDVWYYARKERVPVLVKLCRADFGSGITDDARNAVKVNHYLGCIYVGKSNLSPKAEGRQYLWALDMGTRNTIAASRESNSKEVSFRLACNQLYCILLRGESDMGSDFARKYYAPDRQIIGGFPTMARIYKEGLSGGSRECYKDGCALFPDLELMSLLMEDGVNLQDSAIMTDLKFGEQDDAHERALQIFLYNMLWLGCLECILKGAGKMDIYISYPREQIKKRISARWAIVLEEIRELTDIGITDIRYVTEAEANAKYLQKEMGSQPDKMITPRSIFGICDIGDGTSDFNVYLGDADFDRRPSRIQFSLRYAGGDILVDTIMRLAKNQTDFEKFWNIPSDGGGSNWEIIEKLLGRYQKLNQKSSESQRESRRNIILTLIESVGLKSNLPVDPDGFLRDFAAILTFKYWNLFHVYGVLLEQFVPGEALTFKLYMYGGGRKAIKDAIGMRMEQFGDSEFGQDVIAYLSAQAGVKKENFHIEFGLENKQKTEVVEGMLVQEKEDTIKGEAVSGKENIDTFYNGKTSFGLPGRELTSERIEQFLENYQNYIQNVRGKDYFDISSAAEIRNIYEAISVGDANRRPGSLEDQNHNFFENSVGALWEEITGDEENPGCLWEGLLYSRMSNELLIRNIMQ